MDLQLADKVAFIAASSEGLGKAVALELAKEEAHVIVCGRTEETVQRTAGELKGIGKGRVVALTGDVSKEQDRERMLEAAFKAFGHIDILVTNSGGPKAGTFEELHKKDWDATYELLLGSAVGLIQGVLPKMKARQWGRIITITSQAVKQPVANLILSNSVRASVVGLMKTLASELGAYNITVNNVMPGYTKTARLEKLMAANPLVANAVDEIPLQRFGEPEEFAAAVTFLASERASYITGISLAVDGGWIQHIL